MEPLSSIIRWSTSPVRSYGSPRSRTLSLIHQPLVRPLLAPTRPPTLIVPLSSDPCLLLEPFLKPRGPPCPPCTDIVRVGLSSHARGGGEYERPETFAIGELLLQGRAPGRPSDPFPTRTPRRSPLSPPRTTLHPRSSCQQHAGNRRQVKWWEGWGKTDAFRLVGTRIEWHPTPPTS